MRRADVFHWVEKQRMIYQLHAQDPQNPKDTMFLLQSDAVTDQESLGEWLKTVSDCWKDRADNPGERDPIPDGWVMMICSEDSEHFERTPVAPPITI